MLSYLYYKIYLIENENSHYLIMLFLKDAVLKIRGAVQFFFPQKKLIILFCNDVLKWIKVTVKTFIMLQTISI